MNNYLYRYIYIFFFCKIKQEAGGAGQIQPLAEPLNSIPYSKKFDVSCLFHPSHMCTELWRVWCCICAKNSRPCAKLYWPMLWIELDKRGLIVMSSLDCDNTRSKYSSIRHMPNTLKLQQSLHELVLMTL